MQYLETIGQIISGIFGWLDIEADLGGFTISLKSILIFVFVSSIVAWFLRNFFVGGD